MEKYEILIVRGRGIGIVGVSKKLKALIVRRGLAFKSLFSFLFLTMKTAVLRIFVYTVKAK